MEKAEREFLLLYLAASRERLLESVEGLNEQQQRFRPARDRWSVAECVEHVSIVERGVLRKIEALVLAPQPEIPPHAQPPPRARVPDQVILARVPNRSSRVTAPPEALPGGRWTDFAELLREFEAARERSLRFAAVTQSDLRGHFFAFFLAHCAAQKIGFAKREAGEAAGDAHHLLLIEHHAVGFFENFFQLRQIVGDFFLAVLARDEIVDHAALNGAGAIERVERG